MGIVIQDPSIHEQAEKLAALHGISIEQAIGLALREALQRQQIIQPPRKKATYEELKALVDSFRTLPVYDDRTPDEILGYNEYGAFD